MHGNRFIKSWSTNQSVIDPSSSEAEYYELVKAASGSIGVKTIMKDMGVEMANPEVIKSAASAAIGIANRIGIGKVRHIEVSQISLQEKVSKTKIMIVNVGTEENLADALTKAVDAKIIGKHVAVVGACVRIDRHRLAPKVDRTDNLYEESDQQE